MSYLDSKQTNKTRPELQFKTENNQYSNSLNQKKTIYFRDTLKQNGPNQKYADHMPYAYRSNVKPQGEFPCFENNPKGDFNPLASRENLNKYLKTKNSYFSRHKQCQACQRLNWSYGKNYNTSYQKTFPLIKGSFPSLKQTNEMSYQTRNNGKLKYKLGNYDTNNYVNNDYETYNEDSNVKYPKIEKKPNSLDNTEKQNNRYNTIDATNSIKNDNCGNKVINSYSYQPRFRRTFHKRQIFNNYKPFMVDDFHEYADYE
jgi:hypothetical protein